MILRQIGRAFVLVFAAAFFFGCGKSQPTATATNSSPSSTSVPAPTPARKWQTVARIHWLGKKGISSDTNAAALMQIWNLPESKKLEAQTLDKLATAPWRLLRNQTNSAATNLLHPLLLDILNEESYAEIRQPADATNSTSNEMVLAIRLDDQRAAVWQTNLTAALESLTGIAPTNTPSAQRWALKKHHAPNLIEFARAGGWVVLGAAEDHNELLDETLARIQQSGAPAEHPLSRGTTNAWLEANVDLQKIAVLRQAADRPALALPNVSLIAFGSGTNTYVTGELVSPATQFAALDAWDIPTNLIQLDMTSFTAIRGIAPVLKSWNELNSGPPPNQLFVWSLSDFQTATYFAAPSPDASNVVSKITDLVLQNSEKWHLTNAVARFRKAQTHDGLEWNGLPFLMPFLQSTNAAGTNFIFGGFFEPRTVNTASSNVFGEILHATNLIYYDWERTGERINAMNYPFQFARFVAEKSQLPQTSPGLLWLEALGSSLGESTTRFDRTTIPGHIAFYRNSTVGLTALELHLLADWLESPDFPKGLHTLTKPNDLPK